MANELRIKNGIVIDNFANAAIYTYGLSYNPDTGQVGYMSTASFGSGSTVIGATVLGTAGFISKFTSPTALGNSAIYEDGSNNIGIGTGAITLSEKLRVQGSTFITNGLAASGSIFLPSITDSSTANRVVLVDSNGQLFTTASSALATISASTLFGILGITPQPQSITSFTDSNTFNTDRWNTETDNYSLTGSWTNGQYTFTGANIVSGGITLASTTTANATTLSYNVPASPLSIYSSGSETFILYVTASNPLDNTTTIVSSSQALIIDKTDPGSLTLTSVATTVQLSGSLNEIELGATGSILFTARTGSNNRWAIQSFSGSAAFSTTGVPLFSNSNGASGSVSFFVTGSATGSNSIVLSATASYNSNGLNVPEVTFTRQSSTTFTKIVSLRAGASISSSFTQGELLNLSIWDTTLGGSIGTIYKGTENPSGRSVDINWTGDKYLHIVYGNGFSDLSEVNTSGINVLGSTFPTASTIVGSYKVYTSTTRQVGGAGTTITFDLI